MWFDYYVAAVLFGALFHPQILAELLADTANIHCDSLLRQVRMDDALASLALNQHKNPCF